MSRDRFEVEKLENGYEITVWSKEEKDEEKEDFGYREPKKYVATDKKEVTKLFEKYCP